MKRAQIYCHRIETGELMLAAPELPNYAEAVEVDLLELIRLWMELDESGQPIPKRQDARRANRVRRKAST